MKLFNLLAVAAIALAVSTPAFAGHDAVHGRKQGHMFERLDTNKDEVIQLREFQEGGKRMFDRMDLNKDGKITRAESDETKAKWHKKRLEKGGSHGQVEDSKIFYNR